jgi:AraC-like DNA-binding protein
MLQGPRGSVLGKIASDLHRALTSRAEHGAPGRTAASRIAAGERWSVADVICTSGPADRPFEERHDDVSIAVVVAGSFQYRSPGGRAMMTPGSLLLGNAGDCFECGHEHAAGDRCVAFRYAPSFFEQIAADTGAPHGERTFRASRLPPLRALSPLTARAAAGAALALEVSWEETAVEIAAAAVRLTAGLPVAHSAAPTEAIARVTESVRRIEDEPGAPWTLARLAADAGRSPFHYLRTFQQLTGVTPHQFVLRARLRAAALRLLADDAKVIEVALTAGFGDVSNFNAAFRTEFGVTPRAYRARRAEGFRVPARPTAV